MSRTVWAWAGALVRRWMMRMVRGLLGTRQADWAQAMQAEMADIAERAEQAAADSEREALAFAWGCLCAALGHAFTAARSSWAQVHHAGVLSGATAVLAGCAFMHSAGAPGHYVAMNLLSLVLAVACFHLLPRQRLQADERLRARCAFALGALLLVAGLVLAPTGASPWLHIGPVSLNLPWLLLPALLLASDLPPRSAVRLWALGGLLLACGTLALQADPVLLSLLAAVLAVRAWQRKDIAAACLALAAAALAVDVGPTWQAPQALAFVDQIVHRGFEQNGLMGLGLVLVQALLLWPAMRHRQARQHGLVWGLLVALSLPGWLPSPLVGFAGSLIVGYVLSLAVIGSDTPGQSGTGSGPALAPHRLALRTLRRSGPA